MKNLAIWTKLLVITIFLLLGSNATVAAIEQINPKEQQFWWVTPPNENEPVARLVNEKRAAMAAQKIKEKGPEAVSKDFLDGVYYVVEGDCLYDLSGEFLRSKEWETLQKQNLYLKEPTRLVKTNSKTVILLYPGEELRGLTANIPVKNAAVTAGVGTINNQRPLEETPQLLKLASTTNILLAIWVVTVLIWLLYNYRKINQSRVASGGPPMRNPVLMYAGVPVSGQELTTAAKRLHDISRNGSRLAVIYKTTLSCEKIHVEYSSGKTKSVVFNKEPIYMGVFEKNKKITDVVLFHGYCLNGVLFGEMDTPQLQEVVETFEFGEVTEVSFGDKESDEGPSYQDAINWLQATYGKKQENTEEKPEIVVAEKKPLTAAPTYKFEEQNNQLSLEVGDIKFTLAGCTNATVEEIGPDRIAVMAFIKNNAMEIIVGEKGITITPKTQEKKRRNTKRNNVIEMPSREA